MMGRRVVSIVATVVVLLVALGLLAPARPSPAAAAPAPSAGPVSGTPRAAAPDPAALPLAFVPNAGQTDKAVRYEVRQGSATLFFTSDGVTLAARAAAPDNGKGASPSARGGKSRAQVARARAPQAPAVARIRFAGASGKATIQADAPLAGTVNYLRGSDPAGWQTDLPTYAALTYAGLYPGIDLRYEGSGGHLKGTYTVAPKADPTTIRWDYGTAATAAIDPKTGDLRVELGGGVPALAEAAPVAWQERDGKRTSVDVRYTLGADGRVGFAVGAYDRTLPLVIDPTITYSTYLGSGGNEDAAQVAVDGAGNAYVAGKTYADDFPTQNPQQGTWGGQYDAFVSKFNATGTALVYSTYFGGSGWDEGNGIAVDSAGRAAIAGTTDSTDLPIVNGYSTSYRGGDWDAYVAELTPAGNALRYSTYLGTAGDDEAPGGRAVAVDATGALYVTGSTDTTGFPTKNGYAGALGGTYGDIFLTKLDPAASGIASLVYGTLLGGDGFERGTAVAIAGTIAYLTGITASLDFPVRNAAQATKGSSAYDDYDAFVAALDTAATGNASLVWATYLGGTGYDSGAGIATDGAGGVHVTGYTEASDFPTLNPYQGTAGGGGDAFVARYVASTGARSYSTYLGGAAFDEGTGIAADGSGRAYVTGTTQSAAFPVTQGGPQATRPAANCAAAPCADAFAVALTAAGTGLTYGTFLGGTDDDFGRGIALGSDGSVYVVGQTLSGDFPTTWGAYDTTKNPLEDMFLVKLGPAPAPALPTSDMTLGYDPLGRLISVQPTTAEQPQPAANLTTPGGLPAASTGGGRPQALLTALAGWTGSIGAHARFAVLSALLWVALPTSVLAAFLILGWGWRAMRSRRQWHDYQSAKSTLTPKHLGILVLILAVMAAPPQPALPPLDVLIVVLACMALGVWGLRHIIHGLASRRGRTPRPRAKTPRLLSGEALTNVAAIVIALVPLAIGGGVLLQANSHYAGATPATRPTVESGLDDLVFTANSARMLAVGQQHNLVLNEDGSLWSWGLNDYGQLGYTAPGSYSRYPQQVPFASHLKAVGAGGRHSLAVAQDGTVWTWGYNDSGQLGNNATSTTVQATPGQVSGLTGVVAVAGGPSYSMALTASGTVYMWGSGPLGNTCTSNCQKLTPTLVAGLTGVTTIAAGNAHALALKSDGTVWAWGHPSMGAGIGILGFDGSDTPVQAIGLSGVVSIAAGRNYSAAVKGDGTVWTWGETAYGNQLGRPDQPTCNGIGAPSDCGIPRQVTTLSGITSVTAGSYFSLARGGDGSVWAWGTGFLGQQGSGTQDFHEVPTQVVGPGGQGLFGGVLTVASGSSADHALALRSDGDIWAWGVDRVGELTGVGPDVCQPNNDPPWEVYTRCSLTPIPASNLNARGVPYDVLHNCALSTPWSLPVGAGVCATFGSFLTQQTDLSIATVGAPLEVTRTYHSADPTDVGFGPGWSFPYAMRVTPEPEGSLLVRMADGRRDRYTSDGTNLFTAPAGVYDRLFSTSGGGYSLYTPEQLVYTFAPDGRLASIADRNNNQTTLTWSSTQLVIRDVHSTRTLTLTYGTGADASRFVSLLESGALARSVTYGYDALGNLATVTDVTGVNTTMTYDAGHRLLTLIDPNGQASQRVRLENRYDTLGRVYEQYDAKRERWQYGYNPTLRTTTVTDRNGYATVFTYDTAWRMTGWTDPEGHPAVFGYDTQNNLGAVTDGAGHTTGIGDYDSSGNPQTLTTPLEYQTTKTYTERNDPHTVTVPVAPGITRTTTFGYDTKGNLTTITDPLQVTTAMMTHDPTTGVLLTVTDADSVKTTITYDANGYPRTVTDNLGHTWTYEYDPGGRLRKVVSPLGDANAVNPDGFVTYYDYNAANQVTAMHVVLSASVTLRTAYQYDDNGNVTHVTDPNNLATGMGYDENDNLVAVTDPRGKVTTYGYDANENRIAAVDATGRQTSWSYDKVNRAVAIADQAGHTTKVHRDDAGNIDLLTDPRQATTTYHYDAANRLVWTQDAAGHYTCYDYYRDGQIKRANDAATENDCVTGTARETTYTYDGAGRPATKTDPLGRSWKSDYRPNGLLWHATDGNNHVTTYSYDGANRLHQVAYFDSTAVTYGYDAADRLTSMTDPTGQTTYGYDNADRLKTVTAPVTGTVAYEYDPGSRIITLTHPNSHAVHYAYDDADRLTGITDWLNQTTTYGYDDAGRLTGIAAPNGVNSTIGYDPSGLVSTVTHTKGGATLAGFTYTRDAAGNVTRLQEIGGGGATPAAYTYDPVGNRTSVTTNGSTKYAAYDAANQLCWDGGAAAGTCATPTSGATTYAYDQNGSRIGRTAGGVTTTYGYDPANRLTSVATGGTTTATYQYDGDGYRVGQTTGGATTNYTWDRLDEGGLGTVVADGGGEYVFGPAGVQQRTSGSATQYAHGDALGSVRLITDGSGNAAGSATYEPWGAAQAGATALGGFGFAGEQTDTTTGFVYLRARAYDPATGRFLQQDPAGTTDGSTNLYPYGGNNPTNLTDPSGRCPICFGLLVAAGVIAAPAVAGGVVVAGVAVAPEVLAALFVASAIGVGFGIGWGITQLNGPRAYTGDTGQQLNSPGSAGTMVTQLESPGYTGGSGGFVAGPSAYDGDTFANSGGTIGVVGDYSLLASSRQLGKNLRTAGFRSFVKAQAHHIVAENAKAAAGARRALAAVGLSVNSAENGVWLAGPNAPAPPPGSPNAHEHLPIHTNRYYGAVNQRLFGVSSQPQAIAILDQIRREILAGTFPK